MDIGLCDIRPVSGVQQRRVSNCSTISVSSINLHVWTIDVGSDVDRKKL